MSFGNVTERRYAPPQIGVTCVILALEPAQNGQRQRLWLPLVKRVREPFLGQWALPGGPLQANQSIEYSAYESLASTTDLRPKYLEQLYTFGDPQRSCGGIPMVSICYWALVEQADIAQLAVHNNVRWFADDDLPELAFDHRSIIMYALWRLRHRLDTPQVVRQLVGEPFTLRQLHAVTEAIRGESIDLANYRRKMLSSGLLEETGEMQREGRQRPAALYRFRTQNAEDALEELPNGCDINNIAQMVSHHKPLSAREEESATREALSALTPISSFH